MYYVEEIINGILCFKNTPNGIWKPLSEKVITERLDAANKQLSSLQADNKALNEQLENGANQYAYAIVDNERLREALGFIVEYTFAFESDYEKCLEHIRKLSQTALQNK